MLHLVANVSPEMDSTTAISCLTRKFYLFDASFRLFWQLFTARACAVSTICDVVFEFIIPATAPIVPIRCEHFDCKTTV